MNNVSKLKFNASSFSIQAMNGWETPIRAAFFVSRILKIQKYPASFYEYLQYLEDSYLLFTIPLFTVSERKKQVNPKKVYAIDTGLAVASTWQVSDNFGLLFENLVFVDLKRKGAEISYYATKEGYEVDFVARAANGRYKLF